ncbi:OmpA family protein [Hyalangium sp.]|uniref:OmpA family protein n=1 Tax=Hyalangium sp. TaxID=2028555 RepID=UPI002D4ACF61|nr:OmpA family protein [Hyalangium sp.]HYH98530.1 OmpA family protein [Hyalangium sp.]
MKSESLGVLLLMAWGASACDPTTRVSQQVLILGDSMSGGAAHPEAQAAAELGLDVHVVTPEQWSAMTAEQFLRYRALIIGDATCQSGEELFQAAARNREVWEPIVDGNIILAGQEPRSSSPPLSMEEAIARVSESPSRTGLYLALGCADTSAALGRPALTRRAPQAYCKEDFTVRATTVCEVVVNINYNSSDPDGDPVICTQEPTVLDSFGNHDVRLTCTNSQGSEPDVCLTVVTVTDAIVPVITLKGHASQDVECHSVYSDPGATAWDPCQGDLTSRIRRNGGVIDTVPDTYTLTYEVQDPTGLHALPVHRTVTVRDTTAPSIVCPSPIEAQAGSDGWATVTLPQPRTEDTCSNVTVSRPTEPRFPVGTTPVTYTATDDAGNSTSCTANIVVRPANGPSPLKDRAMLGGGCSAATGAVPAPMALLGLVALWSWLTSRRPRRPRSELMAWLGPWLGCGLILVMLGVGTRAFAQPVDIPAFELERLRLNPSGMGSWVLGTGELLPAGGYRLALVGHYENKPLVLFEEDAQLGVLVRHRATALLSAAVGLWDRVELGAQLPLLLLQQGDDLTDRGVGPPQGGIALGTPLLTVRLRLLAEHQEDPMDLALGVNAGPGLGSADALARELHATPSVMVGRRFGPVRTALDVGLTLRPSTILTRDENIQDEVGHAVRLGAVLASTADGLGGEVAAIGSVPLRREGYSLELLGGVRLPLGEKLEAYGLAGLGLGNAPGTPQFRLLLGMSFGKASRPAAPEDTPAPQELTDPDSDGDGVLDDVDACPDEPGPASRQGCPLRDSDGDGLLDEQDRCPKQAGIAEMRGCPPRDTDGDTVWDHLDNCRTIPGPPHNQGCPANNRQLVVIQRNRIEIKDTIHFDYDKATIKSRSFTLLDQVARVLIEHPEIVSVSIEGHTDALGTDLYNHDLSRRRAGAVRDYLERQGVERERMTIRSFGEDRPLQSNTSEQGRAINRRVEFLTRYESDKP